MMITQPNRFSLGTGKFALSLFAVAAAAMFASPAHAWNIEVGTNFLDSSLYFESWTGDTPTITLLSEGIYANHGVGSFDSTPAQQTWSGSDWPAAYYTTEDIFNAVDAKAVFDHDDGVTDLFADTIYAFVYGDVAPGGAHGAAWSVDFIITLAPFSQATLALSSSDTYASMDSEAGDDGVGFASVKFYDPTIDVNAVNGANDPYDVDSRFMVAPPAGQSIFENLGLSALFINNTDSPLNFTVRLEGGASVFENMIPEPASLAMISLGAMTLIRRRKLR